jgi:hypothetical protein
MFSRSIKSPQRQMRQLMAIVDGTGTAAIRQGSFDMVLTDNGVGDYTLTFNEPFVRRPCVVASSATTDVYCETVDADNSVSAVHILTKNNADAATDAVFHVLIMGADVADEI